MENFLLPRMAVCGINRDVPYVYNTGSAKDFMDSTKKGNGRLGKLAR